MEKRKVKISRKAIKSIIDTTYDPSKIIDWVPVLMGHDFTKPVGSLTFFKKNLPKDMQKYQIELAYGVNSGELIEISFCKKSINKKMP